MRVATKIGPDDASMLREDARVVEVPGHHATPPQHVLVRRGGLVLVAREALVAAWADAARGRQA